MMTMTFNQRLKAFGKEQVIRELRKSNYRRRLVFFIRHIDDNGLLKFMEKNFPYELMLLQKSQNNLEKALSIHSKTNK